MKIKTLTLLGTVLFWGGVACSNVVTTVPDAAGEASQPGGEPVGDGAIGALRRRQLESDRRAREQRQTLLGWAASPSDRNLESAVRRQLATSLPGSQLTVEAESGVVTVSGTVPSQTELERIDPLTRGVEGVEAVRVEATVAPATVPESPTEPLPDSTVPVG